MASGRCCASRHQRPSSAIVVSGWRLAVAGVMYLPVIALRCPVLEDWPALETTEVRGLRAAAALVMYRPVFALRAGITCLTFCP